MAFLYPLSLRFKLLAIAPRIHITDKSDKEILYVEQKVMAMKEAVKVFDNAQDKNLLYTMQANQIIDFGAKYTFLNVKSQREVGAIQQEGFKSLVQARYSVFDPHGKHTYTVVQSNPLIAIFDSILSIIPFAELVTGFILNPTYSISDQNSKQVLLTMKKKPSFFESHFELTQNATISEKDEILLLLSCLMIVQLEKNRG